MVWSPLAITIKTPGKQVELYLYQFRGMFLDRSHYLYYFHLQRAPHTCIENYCRLFKDRYS